MNAVNKKILYAEDDEDDREFLSDAILSVDPQVELLLAENGLKALEHLEELKNNNEELPCVIILDINMPYMNGKDTLEKLKADPQLKHIPVLVFTSSSNPNDKAYFNDLGVQMITKPADPSKLKVIASYMVEACSDQ